MASLRDKKFLREFGAKVRAKREEMGWTQAQFAEQSDLNRSYLAGVESGERNPTLLSLRKIADVLRVSPSDLLQ